MSINNDIRELTIKDGFKAYIGWMLAQTMVTLIVFGAIALVIYLAVR